MQKVITFLSILFLFNYDKKRTGPKEAAYQTN